MTQRVFMALTKTRYGERGETMKHIKVGPLVIQWWRSWVWNHRRRVFQYHWRNRHLFSVLPGCIQWQGGGHTHYLIWREGRRFMLKHKKGFPIKR